MAGLDKIIARIQAESEEAAARTLEAAKAEAETILQNAREEAAAECAAIGRKAEQAAANILDRGHSAAELKKRQRILAEKQVLIGRIIGEAKQQLKNMPQEAYFENIVKLGIETIEKNGNIVKLAVKASQNGKGTILFSKADLDRLPENFADTLNAALVAGGKEGAALTVSSETRDIDGGFVLTYGGIEENCSFDALFDSAHEMLQDKVQEILFGTV